MNNHTPSKQSIFLLNKPSDTGKLSNFLSTYAKSFNISGESYNDLRLIAEEVFINITSYARMDNEQTIKIELSNTPTEINVTFTDSGIAFNPLTDATECKGTDDHCQGGMGIQIIKSLSDHLDYKRIEQHNVFTITKHYTK
jgi:anti-sigma regulatory factor (Ser/Thr protein kinase)